MTAPMAGETRLEVARLEETLPGAVAKVKQDRGETYLCVPRESLVKVMTFLRDDPELEYKYFVECLGVDYSTWPHERDFEERFEVVYNLFSLKHNSRIFVKTAANEGQKVPSLIPVWIGAEYPQRETTDMFGIVFEGNEPRPGERFLMPDDWAGFPLRKEYPLGGEDVLFDKDERGPAVEDESMPYAGASFVGRTGSEDVGGR